jgi:hypothetical protein
VQNTADCSRIAGLERSQTLSLKHLRLADEEKSLTDMTNSASVVFDRDTLLQLVTDITAVVDKLEAYTST